MPSTGWRTFLLLAQLIVPGAGCRQPPSVASAPETDLAGEERAIRDAETRWRDMMRRKDTAAIGSFFTVDAVYAPEDRPPARGRDAIAAMWATNELTLGDVMLERTPIRIDIARSGDVATEVGTWVFRGTPPGEKPFEGRGNYVTAWRKEGGEWKASAYLWNFGDSERSAR